MKLASIEKILEVRNHGNADRLSVVKCLGWQGVTAKNEFKVGDLCVMIVPDTILPDAPWSGFLKDKKDPSKPIRLRMAKFRGEYSQCLCLPLSILPSFGIFIDYKTKEEKPIFWKPFSEGIDGWFSKATYISEGLDVSEAIGVSKYEKPEPITMGDSAGAFPTQYVGKTDETNLLSEPKLLAELNANLPLVVTLKMDGTSATYINSPNEGFIVCSRNMKKKDDEGSIYWKIARKYDLEKEIPAGYAVQGEIVGPRVNGNRLGLTEHEFYAFNLVKIEGRETLGEKDLVSSILQGNFLGVSWVPVVVTISEPVTIESLQELADAQKYPNGSPAEGIVIRPYAPVMSAVILKSLSCKVLNRNYKED